MYTYCNNDPVMYVDFRGESIGGIIAIVALCGGLLFGLSSCDDNESSGPSKEELELENKLKQEAINAAKNAKYTQVLRIDYSGNILGNIELDGIYYDGYCIFNICEELLCVMTLKKRRKGNLELFSPIFHCIQL